MDPASAFAPVDGTRLYYEEAGHGHPLVLLHEGIANFHFWDDQWEAFSKEYRTVRYDLRGFGKSIRPAGSFNMRDDLYRLMCFLDLGRAHLVGASMGGGIAIDFALEHPEMVSALVVVASSLSGGPEPSAHFARAWQEIETAERAGDLDRADALTLRMWVDGPSRRPEDVDASVRERVRGMLRDNRAASAIEGTPVRLHPPARGRLGDIVAPTLVVLGDKDLPEVLQNGDIIADSVPAARKAVIHGAAHALSMEKPAEFNRIVLDFLRGQ